MALRENSRGILTYFVNSIRTGDRSTPYSFVSAPGSPLVPQDMSDVEIVVNEWLAEDLGAKPGDRIELTYFVLGPFRKLEKRSTAFTLRAVVPLEGPAADPTLMPDFPGLADVDNCSDWDPAIPVDLKKIRDKDEKYWDDHRGTPKAFVTLKAAQKMWANEWGRLTAVRFQQEDAPMEEEISKKFPPDLFGLRFRDVRAEAEKAGASGVDFSQLFLGLSFFLIVAALLLTGLLFALGAQDRASETGLLLAVGFTRKKIARLHLREGFLLVLLGSLLGTGGGVLYNHGVLAALATLWRGAVGTETIAAHVRLASLAIGAGSGMACGLAVLWVVLRRMTRRTVRALQTDDEASIRKRKRWAWIALVLFASCLAASLGVVFTQDPGRGRAAAGAFAGAGSLLLLSGLSLCGAAVLRLASGTESSTPRLWTLGIRRASRRPFRSLAVIAVLACGVFLVVAVGANRHDLRKETDDRASGTGGFAFFGETALPLFENPDSAEGRKETGLDDPELADARIVPLRLRDGDDASCLNLNRVPSPRILGVDPRALTERRAFTFTRTLPGIDPGEAWKALDEPLEDGAVPGVADENVIVWGLGKKVGDTLLYTDEAGREFPVRLVGALANSVFQGHVLISDAAFRERFPSVQGARVLLVDVAAAKREQAKDGLLKGLEDRGLVLQDATARLAAFQTVENTYLDIFMLLGGLGLILGSAGLGVVVARNVLERRGELALLRAVGFHRHTLHRLVLWEHAFLFLAGFAVGVIAALLAVVPALSSPGASIPFATLGVLLGGLAASGLAWTTGAAWFALRGDLMPALRDE
jgi:putative ABC transport system permease protein